jgi:hypothetical protein
MDEGAEGAHRGGPLNVNVGQHDQCRVAAQLQVDPLQMLAGQPRDGAARPGGSGEHDHPDVGIGDHCLAGARRARQDVQEAAGQPGPGEDLGQHHTTADRGPRVRLEDDRVTQRQRGRDRPDGQDRRDVERRDHANHSGRHVPGQAQPGLLGPQHVPVRLRGERGRLVALIGGDMHLQIAHRRDGAGFPGQPHLDLIRMGVPQIARAPQHGGPLAVGRSGPVPLGLLGPARRPAHVGWSGVADPAELLSGGRLGHRVLATGTCPPAIRKDLALPGT